MVPKASAQSERRQYHCFAVLLCMRVERAKITSTVIRVWRDVMPNLDRRPAALEAAASVVHEPRLQLLRQALRLSKR